MFKFFVCFALACALFYIHLVNENLVIVYKYVKITSRQLETLQATCPPEQHAEVR